MSSDLEHAYGEGLRGDLDAIDAALARDAPDVEDRAWQLALRALRWFASDPSGNLSTSTVLAGFAGSAGARAATRAGVHALRARALSFDVEGVWQLSDAVATLSGGTGWGSVAQAWAQLCSGEAIDDGMLENAVQWGKGKQESDLVIEATSLRALGAAEAGDLEGGLRFARQGSRMARTESIPQMEHFAHLVLARVRRLCGKPHLARRIIAGLGRVATRPWWPWLAWELLLAEGRWGSGPLSRASVDADSLPQILGTFLEGARAGDRVAVDRAEERLLSLGRGFAPFLRDAEALIPLVDPKWPLERASPKLLAFCRGAPPHHPPRGLIGTCGAEAEDGAHLVWVVAPEGGPARRLLAAGLGLGRAALRSGGPIEATARQIRTHSAIALLLTAGPLGMEEDALFRSLYGFAYEPERHQSVRGVLYNRVKKRLGDRATLERHGGRVCIAPHADLLVCDPRCTPPPELRILAVLSRRRQAAPKDVAKALGISLRSAQEALRRLRDDGALRSERAGRGLHYILEDTTYSEPTRVRRSG